MSSSYSIPMVNICTEMWKCSYQRSTWIVMLCKTAWWNIKGHTINDSNRPHKNTNAETDIHLIQWCYWEERDVSFNVTLNIFWLQLYWCWAHGKEPHRQWQSKLTATHPWATLFDWQQGIVYITYPIDRITHAMAFESIPIKIRGVDFPLMKTDKYAYKVHFSVYEIELCLSLENWSNKAFSLLYMFS